MLVDGATGSNNVLLALPMNSSVKRESVFASSTPATSSSLWIAAQHGEAMLLMYGMQTSAR